MTEQHKGPEFSKLKMEERTPALWYKAVFFISEKIFKIISIFEIEKVEIEKFPKIQNLFENSKENFLKRL